MMFPAINFHFYPFICGFSMRGSEHRQDLQVELDEADLLVLPVKCQNKYDMYCWYLLVQSLFFVCYTPHLYHILSSLLVRFHIFFSLMKHRTVASYHFISVFSSEGCPRILAVQNDPTVGVVNVTSSKGIKRSCLKIGDPNGSKLKH